MIIDKDRTFTVSKGGSFSFLTDISGIQFSNPTGTVVAGGTIVTDIIYPNAAAIDTATIVLNIAHTDGCPSTVFVVSKINPCTMVVQDINYYRSGNVFNFTTSVTGGSGQYSYQWIYPSLLYQPLVNMNSPHMKLSPIVKPAGFTITLTVTDEVSKCQVVKTYDVTVLNITAPNITVSMNCVLGVDYKYYGYIYLPTDYPQIVEDFTTLYNTEPDWTTLEFISSNTLGFSVVSDGDGGLQLYGGLSVTEGSYANVIQYRVSDSSNNTTLYGNINFETSSCDFQEIGDITLVYRVVRLSPDAQANDVIYIDAEKLLYSGNEIDWDTFQFTNTPDYGTVTLDKDHFIRYTISSISTGNVDFIDFKVNDIKGNISPLGSVVINHNSVARPTVANQSYEVIPGVKSDYVDITDSSSGSIDMNSVAIVDSDYRVRVFKNTDNQYSFLVSPGVTENLTLTYKVANPEGYYSTNGTITLNVVSAGITLNTDITVKTKTFDLISLFRNYTSGTRTWTEVTSATQGSTSANETYADQSGTIVGNDGTVDFTSIDPGEYVFELEVENNGTTSTQQVQITLGVTPEIEITSSTDNTNGTFTIFYDITNIVGLELIVANSKGTYVINPTLGSGTGSGRITAYFIVPNGNNIVTLRGFTNYAIVVEDTVTIANSTSTVL